MGGRGKKEVQFMKELNNQKDWNNFRQVQVNFIPVWLRKRLISAGLEPVLSHTENHVTYPVFYEYKSVQS